MYVPLTAVGASRAMATGGLKQTGIQDGCAVFAAGSGDWSFRTP